MIDFFPKCITKQESIRPRVWSNEVLLKWNTVWVIQYDSSGKLPTRPDLVGLIRGRFRPSGWGPDPVRAVKPEFLKLKIQFQIEKYFFLVIPSVGKIKIQNNISITNLIISGLFKTD